MSGSLGEFEQLILLAMLRLGEDAYGVTIQDSIHSRTERDVSIGSVYTTLDRLEKKGYVSSRMGDPTPERGGRRKKLYQLEAAGARALTHSCRAVLNMIEGVEAELEALEG